MGEFHSDQYHEYVYGVLDSVYIENALPYVNRIAVTEALAMIKAQLITMSEIFPQISSGVG